MEIRNRAELDVLYPEPQKGIRYDSPELLLMKHISENNMDGAMTLFCEKRQFSENPPAVDTPYGRLNSIRISDYAWMEKEIDWQQTGTTEEEARKVNAVREFPAGVGRKPQETL